MYASPSIKELQLFAPSQGPFKFFPEELLGLRPQPLRPDQGPAAEHQRYEAGNDDQVVQEADRGGLARGDYPGLGTLPEKRLNAVVFDKNMGVSKFSLPMRLDSQLDRYLAVVVLVVEEDLYLKDEALRAVQRAQLQVGEGLCLELDLHPFDSVPWNIKAMGLEVRQAAKIARQRSEWDLQNDVSSAKKRKMIVSCRSHLCAIDLRHEVLEIYGPC